MSTATMLLIALLMGEVGIAAADVGELPIRGPVRQHAVVKKRVPERRKPQLQAKCPVNEKRVEIIRERTVIIREQCPPPKSGIREASDKALQTWRQTNSKLHTEAPKILTATKSAFSHASQQMNNTLARLHRKGHEFLQALNERRP